VLATSLTEDLVNRKATLLVLAAGFATFLLSTSTAGAQERVRLTGSGASFPFPLYSAWFKSFSSTSKSISVDYQAKGSGAGIQDFINHTVDFAASDAAIATGLPPKVDACEPGTQSMTLALLITTPSGMPEAMPLALQTMSG